MEAPEFVKNWGRIIAIAIFAGCAYPLPVFEYELTAHAALTAAIVQGYNSVHPSGDISADHRFAMISGSVDEDQGTRSTYHFYDPTNGRGLTYAGKTWMSAVKWARSPANAFTWEAALAAYARGDDQQAFLIFGHVLHLLEDMGVPEHARNDAHPVSSPYESFTKPLVPDRLSAPPVRLAGVDGYMKAMAAYSNANFYSADTITGTMYPAPKPDYFQKEGKYEFAFKTINGEKYHLARVIGESFDYFKNTQEKILVIEEKSGDTKILSDYWRLLSQEVIRNGVGLTALFIEEGEKLRKEESVRAAAEKKRAPKAKGMMASVLDTLLPGVSGEDDQGDGLIEDDPVDVVGANGGVSNPISPTPPATKAAAKKKTAGAGDESARPEAATSDGPGKAANVPFCSYADGGAVPRRTSVIINEVAWMGSRASATDEWIELKNIGTSPADLAGWQIVSQKGRVKEILPHAPLAPGAFYLLERTSDGAAPNAKADRIYQGSLSNSSDGLRLFEPGCAVADEAVAAPSWPAGNAATRRTMERGAAFSWHDYSGAGSSGIFGTPKRENSAPAPIIVTSPTPTSVGGSAAPAPASSSGSQSASPSSPASPALSGASGTAVINEFLFDAVGADAGKEFIELYNPSDAALDLAGWSIQTQSTKKNFEDGNAIAAKGCFLIVLGSGGTLTPGMRWTSGSLNNTARSIYISKDQAFVSGDADPNIVDRTAYSNATPGISAGMSLERGDSGAFHVRAVPNPGDCSREAQASSAAPPASAQPAASAASSSGFLSSISSIRFYKDPQGDGSIVDLHFNSYPFIPGNTDRWKALVFYLNGDPVPNGSIGTAQNWAPSDPRVMEIHYPVYCGGCDIIRPSLILPDTAARSDSDGGLYNVAYQYRLIERDKMIRVRASRAHAGDYITIGYYDFSASGGGNQELALVLADPTRYRFEDPKLPPVLTGALTTSFDPAQNLLTVTVPPVPTDPGYRISYSFSVNGSILTIPYSARGTYSFFVTFGDDLELEYLAKDEFGIGSVPLSDEWGYPGAVTWKLVQDKADGDSAPFGPKDGGSQSISFPQDTRADVFAVRMSSDRGLFDSGLHLTIEGDQGGAPDGIPIASKSIPFGGAVAVDPTRDVTFILDQPVTFKKDVRYWLVLDSEVSPGEASGYAPHLHTRIFSASDAYAGGSAGFFSNAGFVPNQPSASSDWYMKIGYREL